MLYVYDTGINSEEIKNLHVAKNATLGDYQIAGKRPHVRIIESVINARNLKPTVAFNIARCRIETVESM